jgi:general secretion pathway protein G
MRKILFVAIFPLALAACSPTHVSGLDRVVKVEEFDQQADLRSRVVAECASNPGQLKEDPNCINANASQAKVDAEEQKKQEEAQQKEALAVAAGVAALVANPQSGREDEERRVAAKQDISTIMTGLKLYRLDNGSYPTQVQGLAALVTKPEGAPNWKDGGYLDRIPNDPWGNPYQFLNPGVHGEIDVFSYGADGKPGGQGNDADVGSWE